MRGPSIIRVWLACMALWGAGRAEIIDRIAASVGNRVITESDLTREIRVTAFQDGIKPDFGPQHKRATLQALIEQKLIRLELENSRYPLPDPAELTPAIDEFKKEHFKDEADYSRTLAGYGITEEDFKDELLWQRTLLLFIEVRFESGVQVSDEEVSAYFENTVKAAAQAAHPGVPVVLEDYRDQIEKKLAGDRANVQMDTWLKEARRNTVIVIHDEVLGAAQEVAK